MNRFGKTARLVAMGVVMAGLLVLGVIQRQITLANAKEVLMVSEAVDPRALLVGHFAILNLQPQTWEIAENPKLDLKAGEKTFVRLAPEADKGRWRIVSLTKTQPTITAGELALQAKITAIDTYEGRTTIRFAYGPDRIYLDQAEAMAVEDATRRLWIDPDAQAAAPQPTVYAILAVSADGAVSVKGVELGGERFESTW
jgi:uncharacterized membrane-anchored protein